MDSCFSGRRAGFNSWVDHLQNFLVVTDLFDEYDLVVDTDTHRTSVYCTSCEDWIATYEGDEIRSMTQAQLHDRITDMHIPDDVVRFPRWWERL